MTSGQKVTTQSAKIINLNFHPLEVVCHYRDPHLPVSDTYSDLFNLRQSICESRCSNAHFVPNNDDFFG